MPGYDKPERAPLCKIVAERKQPAKHERGLTHVFEVRENWVPELGSKMAKIHDPAKRKS
ncbi:MAG: hypothetical protein AAGH76_15355 [Pseudomonadota bacterium]